MGKVVGEHTFLTSFSEYINVMTFVWGNAYCFQSTCIVCLVSFFLDPAAALQCLRKYHALLGDRLGEESCRGCLD